VAGREDAVGDEKNRGEGCWRWLIVERLRERIREARVNVVPVG
jgi:hypothetical protein